MNIAIIPARIGSKRIKYKNIKLFSGKPMIYYAIRNLKKTNIFDQIYVSTDSKIIADIAKSYKAEVPFLRDKRYADDFTPIHKVIKDFLKKLYSKNDIESVCCCFPCTPLINENIIKKGFEKYKKNKSKFIFPVIKYTHPIQRALKLDQKKNSFKLFQPSNEVQRTQDLEQYYFDSGQFYFGSKNSWMRKNKILENSKPFIIDNYTTIDIDTLDDWKFAEKIFKLRGKH